MNNYSISDVLKEIGIKKKDCKSDIEYDINDHQWAFKKMREQEWNNQLNNIDISFIERYLRKKKLEKLKNG